MGLKNVKTVIASGNVVFDSPLKAAALETKIEKALPKLLGFKSTTIIRSKRELEALQKKNPFKKADAKLYHIVTFLKKKTNAKFPSKGGGYKVHATYPREICCAVNINAAKTPDIIRLAEIYFGKEITTRTWKTVGRIVNAMA